MTTTTTHPLRKPRKRNHNAIGDNISYLQRFTEQYSRKEAIILSQSESGKVPLMVSDKITILIPADSTEEQISNYLKKYAI